MVAGVEMSEEDKQAAVRNGLRFGASAYHWFTACNSGPEKFWMKSIKWDWEEDLSDR